ncbi:potassium channel family protein [Bacillus sp. T33-2]|uniref:potassium channel family protein n=1 Tax=Bacillus sp. T33-2 TaxID=2054168 RepID=UPI000C75C0FA|nr:potassium channel family protein [Bacillus sp. T33-2]PLR92680.1 ion transporter [Bacillus sp. T33-2]
MNRHLYIRFIRLPLLLRTLLITLSLIFIFGVLVHVIEPENFPTAFDGVWWAIITASTVGYGDFVPTSIPGRITGIVLLFVGAGFLSSYFITLSATAATKQNAFVEGKIRFKGDNHLIIVGWNERSRGIIKSLADTRQPVILIDETLESNPVRYHHIHFIKGKSHRDEILLKAKIGNAETVIITADQNLDELQADMNTILTLLAIKGLNPDVRCIAEILTNEQVNNARRAGADEIIQTNLLTSAVIMNTVSSNGMVDPLLDLMGKLQGQKVTYRPAGSVFSGKIFREAHTALLSEGTVLIGIKKEGDTVVNPPHDLVVEAEDQLLIITGN